MADPAADEKGGASTKAYISAANMRQASSRDSPQTPPACDGKGKGTPEALEEKSRFKKLKEDFNFNLRLLEERDAELERYDTAFANLRAVLKDRDAEIGELKITVSDLQTQLKAEQERATQETDQTQRKLQELREEAEAQRQRHAEDLRGLRDEADMERRGLTQQLADKSVELENTRRDLISRYEEEKRQRELDFRLKEDELTHSLKVAQVKSGGLEKELVFANQERGRISDSMEEIKSQLRDTEKELKTSEWNLAETIRIKDSRIAEAEEEAKQLQSLKTSAEEDYEKRISELVESLHKSEQWVSKQREDYELKLQRLGSEKDESARDQEARMEARISDLQEQLDSSRAENDRMRTNGKQESWQYEDKLKDKQREIDDGLRSLSAAKKDSERDRKDSLLELSEKDREIKMLKVRIDESKVDRESHRAEIEEYKAALQTAQDKCEDAKREAMKQQLLSEATLERKTRDQHIAHEDVVRGIQAEKEKAELVMADAQRSLKEALAKITTSKEELVDQKKEASELKEKIRQLEGDLKLSEQYREKEREQYRDAAHSQEMQIQEQALGFEMAQRSAIAPPPQPTAAATPIPPPATASRVSEIAPPQRRLGFGQSQPQGPPGSPMTMAHVTQADPREVTFLRQRIAELESIDTSALQEENRRLRLRLSELIEQSSGGGGYGSGIQSDSRYVQRLEMEMQDCRRRADDLEEQNISARKHVAQLRDELANASRMPSAALESLRSEKWMMEQQIVQEKRRNEELADQISRLRAELLDAQSDAHREHSRVVAIEANSSRVIELEHALHDKQQRITELEYELSVNVPHAFNRKQEDMDSALTSARREAEEARIEARVQSGEVRALNDQISSLRHELLAARMTTASPKPQVDHQSAELRIRLAQSDSELNRVRSENNALRAKLEEAARDLRHLVAEREKLIDISNRLRSDLTRISTLGTEEPPPPPPPQRPLEDLLDVNEQRARNKLMEAKASLRMAGSQLAQAQHEVPPTPTSYGQHSSGIASSAQKPARLRTIMRRRGELGRQRRGMHD